MIGPTIGGMILGIGIGALSMALLFLKIICPRYRQMGRTDRLIFTRDTLKERLTINVTDFNPMEFGRKYMGMICMINGVEWERVPHKAGLAEDGHAPQYQYNGRITLVGERGIGWIGSEGPPPGGSPMPVQPMPSMPGGYTVSDLERYMADPSRPMNAEEFRQAGLEVDRKVLETAREEIRQYAERNEQTLPVDDPQIFPRDYPKVDFTPSVMPSTPPDLGPESRSGTSPS